VEIAKTFQNQSQLGHLFTLWLPMAGGPRRGAAVLVDERHAADAASSGRLPHLVESAD
jgi:hypothetical protein